MNKIVYDSYYYGHPSKSSTMLEVALDAEENAKVMNASGIGSTETSPQSNGNSQGIGKD